ncbi:MAG: TIGR03086 family metal-binding protein [Acidimicrobiia bacterium]
MQPLEAMETAIAQTRPIVAAISPDQYERTTPCTDWDVRALLDHLLGVLALWRDLPSGTADPAVLGQAHIGDDPSRSYDALAAAVLTAWRADSVVDNPVQFPGSEMPGGFAARMLAGDVLLHGWDLARATGQTRSWDEELAADILDWQEQAARRFPPDVRARAFAPEVAVPAGADTMTRLVGFVGRQR